MPTYNPKKSPVKYPAAFGEALEKASHGAPFEEYRTRYTEFPPDVRRLRISQHISSFKASLRNFPAHPLAKIVDDVGTRVEWEGNVAVIVSWKVFRPAMLLEGLV